MITSNDKLIVLDDLQIDRKLPKYQKKPKGSFLSSSKSDDLDLTEGDSSEDEQVQFRPANNVLWNNGSVGVQLQPMDVREMPVQAPQSLLSKLAFWKKPLPPTTLAELVPEPTLSIEEFFKSIKNSAQELAIVEERAQGYERALLNAKKAGQEALVEQLTHGLNASKMETQLIAMGLTKFVAEEDIVRFYKQCKKGLRLDYVRNFTRHIPGNVTEKKAHADELGLFDNYAVLHYDPKAKSYAETEAEKARRKDPILFGLIQGRRYLYVVGDWIDEVCDLTLDQLAEQIGKGAIQDLLPEVKTYRT